MNKFKQWAKDNKDLLIIGGCFAGVTAITVALVIAARDEDGVGEVFRNFSGHEDHNFAGLLGMGKDGGLWAHPVNAHSFQIGQTDGVTMQYCEYTPPDVDVTDLASVESAMVAEETN